MAWKVKFEEELAITENLKKLNNKHEAIIKESQMSGREYFEKNKHLAVQAFDDDVEEDDEDVDDD